MVFWKGDRNLTPSPPFSPITQAPSTELGGGQIFERRVCHRLRKGSPARDTGGLDPGAQGYDSVRPLGRETLVSFICGLTFVQTKREGDV